MGNYRQGYQYKKAGVIVMNIGPDSPIQQDLFDMSSPMPSSTTSAVRRQPRDGLK